MSPIRAPIRAARVGESADMQQHKVDCVHIARCTRKPFPRPPQSGIPTMCTRDPLVPSEKPERSARGRPGRRACRPGGRASGPQSSGANLVAESTRLLNLRLGAEASYCAERGEAHLRGGVSPACDMDVCDAARQELAIFITHAGALLRPALYGP